MDNRWVELQDKHKGETGLVIGNGPSLKEITNEELQRFPSFGTNKIFLKEGFTPTYYVCTNPYMIPECVRGMIGKTDCIKFIREGCEKELPGSIPLHLVDESYFSSVPHRFVYEGYTITYVCLQLAYFMGFQNILLYGIDHRYDIKEEPNSTFIASGLDHNHFHDGYFAPGWIYQAPDLENSRKHYLVARRAFEYKRRNIYNMTKDSALDVFERLSKDDPKYQELTERRT